MPSALNRDGDFIDPWPPDPPSPVVYYTKLTVVCVAHGFVVGQVISITGCSLYNVASTVVTDVVDADTFKIANYSTDASVGAGGNATSLGASISRVGNVTTATTSADHDFYPGLLVAISGLANTAIGGGIAAIARLNNVVTIQTTGGTGLTAGCTVQVAGVTDTSFNGTFLIENIIDATHFSYAQTGSDAADATGNVYDIWVGSFYVTSAPTSKSFTYKQVGPNNQTTNAGTATPTGQVIAGQRGLVLMFLTRQGYMTAPSPPLTVFADGSKHLLITNIPLGPANVIARVFGFTESGGQNYFILPVPAALNGQQISTSTYLNDNTSTSVLLDFSDTALGSGIAIDVAGNNLFAQVVLGPCLNLESYASRMFWWGERNKVQNFYNMGFEGGYNALTAPMGWTVETVGGLLVTTGDIGQGWQITGPDAGRISQTCFRDPYGARVLLDDTQYTFRCWAQAQEVNQAGFVLVEIYDSTAATVLASAEIPLNTISTDGAFVEADFTAKTPTSLPVGSILRISASGLVAGKTVVIDELEIVYTDRPYLNNTAKASYVDNPEAFDGVTGIIGPANDESALMNMFNIRDNLYLLSARLYSTKDLADAEPSLWPIAQVADKCASVSAFGLDSGEDWAMWATQSGMRIFDGQFPDKISQEIQTKWNDLATGSQHRVWLTNDPAARRTYIGMPTGTSVTPDKIYVMDYRELDAAGTISSANPARISFAGKVIAMDFSRKWTIWNLKMNCGAILQRPLSRLEFCVGAGNGLALRSGTGFGTVYEFDADKLTDDDYGRINFYYTTYFFIGQEDEGQLQLGGYEKRYTYMSLLATGVGLVSITPLAVSLSNAWASTPQYPLAQTQSFDFEWGLNVLGERCAFRINVSPITDNEDPGFTNGTDIAFNAGKMVISMRQEAIARLRGAI